MVNVKKNLYKIFMVVMLTSKRFQIVTKKNKMSKNT